MLLIPSVASINIEAMRQLSATLARFQTSRGVFQKDER